jgi:hypothetical protein
MCRPKFHPKAGKLTYSSGSEVRTKGKRVVTPDTIFQRLFENMYGIKLLSAQILCNE